MDKIERTTKLIEAFKGLPGEWSMLKGVLCQSFMFEVGSMERDLLRSMFDVSMLTTRMDKIDLEEFDKANKEFKDA